MSEQHRTFMFGQRSKLTLIDVILFLVETCPGRTEAELAEAIFGKKAYQQRVNPDCRRLADMGDIERRGYGGPGDPFRYYPVPPGRV
jgi:hypothetical protein